MKLIKRPFFKTHGLTNRSKVTTQKIEEISHLCFVTAFAEDLNLHAEKAFSTALRNHTYAVVLP